MYDCYKLLEMSEETLNCHCINLHLQLNSSLQEADIYVELTLFFFSLFIFFSNHYTWGTWLVQSEKPATLNLQVVSSIPKLGVEMT